MEPEENIVNPLQPEQGTRGCYRANLILNAFAALGLGIAVIVILNVFNRSGWFALLSGSFGALLYCAIVFPRILFSPNPDPRRRFEGNGNPVGEQQDRHTAKGMAVGGFAISSILAIGSCIGLYYFPANQPIFAFVDALLAIVLCIALFITGLSLLAFFLGRGHMDGNGGYFDL